MRREEKIICNKCGKEIQIENLEFEKAAWIRDEIARIKAEK